MLDLSLSHSIKDINHWYKDINQLYHPTGEYEQDSQSIIYSKDLLNTTKFDPILLKEWFYLVSDGGYLVIDYKVNNLLDWQKLEKNMWWLWQNNYEVIFHNSFDKKISTHSSLTQFISEITTGSHDNITPDEEIGSYLRFICKKTNPTVYTNDSIDKWSFGIISNGQRDELIEKIIKSIHSQDIKEYEIIICGTYNGSIDNVKYLPFSKRDKLGWISKKKNIIVENAKYENICMLHDRLLFTPNWFKNMKKWGNCFEHIGSAQVYEGIRSNDYLLHESIPNKPFGFASLMDYKDWDKSTFNAGQLHIAKKRFLKKIKWNESLFWGEPEDLEISELLTQQGYILRNNSSSVFNVLMARFIGELPKVVFNATTLSTKREGSFLRILGRKIYTQVSSFKLLSRFIVFLAIKIYHKGKN